MIWMLAEAVRNETVEYGTLGTLLLLVVRVLGSDLQRWINRRRGADAGDCGADCFASDRINDLTARVASLEREHREIASTIGAINGKVDVMLGYLEQRHET